MEVNSKKESRVSQPNPFSEANLPHCQKGQGTSSHLAHISYAEMAETLHQHYQQLTEPTSAQSESSPSRTGPSQDRPQRKKRKSSPPKQSTVSTASDEALATEPSYTSGENYLQNSRPADVGTAFHSDGEIADLIERSITRLIPSIADKAVRRLHMQTTASPTISLEHDQDVDMDITRLRDEALHSRQAGRVLDRHCPANILPVVHQKVLHQIKTVSSLS